MRQTISRVAAVLCAVVVLAVPGAASAAVPTGRIAYTAVSQDSSEWLVRVVNPDGSGARTVYSCPTSSCELLMSDEAWDPAGKRVVVGEWTRVPCVFYDEFDPTKPPVIHPELYGCRAAPVRWDVINVDSGAVQTVTPPALGNVVPVAGWAGMPFWSQDGTWIAFSGSQQVPCSQQPSFPYPSPFTNACYAAAAYAVHPDGSGQTPLLPGGGWTDATGWTLDGKPIVYTASATFKQVDLATGVGTPVPSLITVLAGHLTNPSPDGRFIAMDAGRLADNTNLQVFTLDQSVSSMWGPTWAPDSTELAYMQGYERVPEADTLPGPTPIVARAPAPGSPVRTIIAGERVVGAVSWSPPPDPAVKIDTPVAGQEITGHESTPAAKDAVQLTGSVSSHTALSGWCYAIQAPNAAVPATPPKSSCNRPFDSSSPPPSPGGRITSRFKTDLGTLVGKELGTGENTVWVWGYGASLNPDLAKVIVKVLPNYYVKHTEVAQAVGEPLGSLPADHSLSVLPLTETWSEPVAVGPPPQRPYPVKLVAGKSTLVRVYVGDASLTSGQSTTATLKVDVSLGQTQLSTTQAVVVTAPDKNPDQVQPDAAINVWFPGAAAVVGADLTVTATVNPGETTKECQGCYPNGNEAVLDGVRFDQAGTLALTPVPIFLKDGHTVLLPSPEYQTTAFPRLQRALPLADDAVRLLPPLPPLTVDAKAFGLVRADGFFDNDICDEMSGLVWAYLLASTPGASPPGSAPTLGASAGRFLGFASPKLTPGASVCTGIAPRPGSYAVVLDPDVSDLRHELGHSLGLQHADASTGAAGAVPLPYTGIWGPGYALEPNGSTLILDPAKTGDIMSYAPLRWASPYSWSRLLDAILAPPSFARDTRAIATARHDAAPTGAVAARAAGTRRIVAGVLAGDASRILTSFDAPLTGPVPGSGPVAGSVVALGRDGRAIAAATVHGNPSAELPHATGGIPFAISLPDDANTDSLALRSRTGKTLTTFKAGAHPPHARFLRLPKRATRSRPLAVRFTVRDPDHDPMTIIVSARRGKGPWHVVAFATGTIGAATVDPRRLGNGGTLTVRVEASDGIHTTTLFGRPIRLRR